MSKTNTNTGSGNYNCIQHARRGRWSRGGSGGQAQGGCGDHKNRTITKSSFGGKMKEFCLNKFIITEYSHKGTRLKKLHNTLSVLAGEFPNFKK